MNRKMLPWGSHTRRSSALPLLHLLVVALLITVVTQIAHIPTPQLAAFAPRPAQLGCDTVRVAVNTSQASATQLQSLTDAMNRWSSATGVSFETVGSTSLIPQTSDADAWSLGGAADVVVAFATPSQSDLYAAGLSAEGLSDRLWVPAGATLTKVSSSGATVTAVVFNPVWLQTAPAGFGPGTQGAVLLHEFGHVLGLSHASSSTSVMFPRVDVNAGAISPADVVAARALLRSCSRS